MSSLLKSNASIDRAQKKLNMESSVSAVLLPVRFLSLLAHFFCTLLITWNRNDHVAMSVQGSLWRGEERVLADTEDARYVFNILLGCSFACFSVEFVGLLSGASMFRHGVSIMTSVLHFCGAFFLFWFALEGWRSSAYGLLFAFFNVLPTLPELFFMVGSLVQCLRLEKRLQIKMGDW